ncbi:hypothetical protein D3C76_752990 [compost metagenome]|uniref:DUF2971 domain-containing protein n=1 Tax=unclassified Pseudomonas TaxID=196821 RepID=UPI000FBC2572|nr:MULTISPECIES: DUF2971 domain-containing protein [unclassified Pseudomonas]MDN4511444.1 DUF2971 domain-containing protein [Pseudomonas sp. 2,4-D]
MILYKYMSAEGLSATISGLTVRFTAPYFFNDPFDCAISNYRTEEKHDFVNLNNSLRIMQNRYRLGALCLTRAPFNLLMWAHYADNHKGAVVGIDTSRAGLECNESNIITAQSGSVIYTSVRPSTAGIELPSEVNSTSDRSTLEKMFLQKSIHWAYEEEVRILRVIHKEYDEFTIFDNSMAHRDVTIPKEAIKEIYLGSRFEATATNKELVRTISEEFQLERFAKCYLDNVKWDIKAKAITKSLAALGIYFF